MPSKLEVVEQHNFWECDKAIKGGKKKKKKVKEDRGSNYQGWYNGGSVEIEKGN